MTAWLWTSTSIQLLWPSVVYTCRVHLSFPFLLLLSVCLTILHWFPPLIYFLLVLPISRDWVTVIICLNSYLQISLFSVHFLTHNWFSFPEGSLTWESGAFLSLTKVSLSLTISWPPLKPFSKWSLSFSITSPLAQSLSLSHSLLPSLCSILFFLLMSFWVLELHPLTLLVTPALRSLKSSYAAVIASYKRLSYSTSDVQGGVSKYILMATFEDSRGRFFLAPAKPLCLLWLLPLGHWHLNELTSHAKKFSEHWILRLSDRQ